MSKTVVDSKAHTPELNGAPPDPATAFQTLRQSVIEGELRGAAATGGIKFDQWPCPEFLTQPGERIDLARLPTEIVGHGDKPRYPGSRVMHSKHTNAEARHKLARHRERIRDLLILLYDQGTRGLLEQISGDNAGKDGIIAHTFHSNPEWFTTHNFKEPEGVEKSWRAEPNWRFMQHIGPPGTVTLWSRGAIGDVVFACPTEAERAARCALLNEMELGLVYGLPLSESGRVSVSGTVRPDMTLFKVFLNGSKLEQAQRFVDRLKDKPRKIDLADIQGHPEFDQTRDRFGDALTRVNTPEAPVYVIPGDNKDQARLIHASILYHVLKDMIRPEEPTANPALSEAVRSAHLDAFKAEVKAGLED